MIWQVPKHSGFSRALYYLAMMHRFFRRCLLVNGRICYFSLSRLSAGVYHEATTKMWGSKYNDIRMSTQIYKQISPILNCVTPDSVLLASLTRQNYISIHVYKYITSHLNSHECQLCFICWLAKLFYIIIIIIIIYYVVVVSRSSVSEWRDSCGHQHQRELPEWGRVLQRTLSAELLLWWTWQDSVDTRWLHTQHCLLPGDLMHFKPR